MNNFPKYEWTVVFKHDLNSFNKTVTPVAINYKEAVTEGMRDLTVMGYDPEGFIVIEIKRGRSL